MKIGIVTINDMTNYGNRLQNYAVTHILSELGLNCKTLTVKENSSMISRVKKKTKYYISVGLTSIVTPIKPETVRRSNFERFTKRYINQEVYVCSDLKMPSKYNEEFDYFIVGSDQVWNPTFWHKEDEEHIFHNHLLGFVEDKKRISYAASFGISKLPERWNEEFAKELKKFKAISVREDAGFDIIKNLTEREAEVLIDPTMMLDASDWRKLSRKSRKRNKNNKPYILKYYLGGQSEERKEFISSIAQKNDLEIYDLFDFNDPKLYTAGPDEFIDLIDNASLVCTDSFHAVVFSILFGKPFLIMDREQEGMENMNSRIETLMKKLNLRNRSPEAVSEDEIFYCNYEQAYKILNSERNKVKNFLETTLV